MPDETLPVSGKDTKIVLLLGGVPVKINDQVTEFSVKPVYDEIETKHLGVSGRHLDKEFLGYEGSITCATNTSVLDDFIDTINAALIARTPVRIDIVDQINYRNGTSQQKTYPDCKVDWDSKNQRGQARTVTLAWKNGVNRIGA